MGFTQLIRLNDSVHILLKHQAWTIFKHFNDLKFLAMSAYPVADKSR